ncbi:unnamed protein product [Mycena citricolor]|uniref:C2H2-type domain-containing protein n=1 Tax=Mycena citricolor TaxID=2018698 RepID=A0AAD2GQW6_9AGAR|nr:unnamed protein product [Mycena citricolor]
MPRVATTSIISRARTSPVNGGGVDHQCTECIKSFRRPSDLERHFIAKHLPAQERDKYMKYCTFPGCSHKSLQKSNLETHYISQHTQTKPYKCSLATCDKEYADPSALSRHKHKHIAAGEMAGSSFSSFSPRSGVSSSSSASSSPSPSSLPQTPEPVDLFGQRTQDELFAAVMDPSLDRIAGEAALDAHCVGVTSCEPPTLDYSLDPSEMFFGDCYGGLGMGNLDFSLDSSKMISPEYAPFDFPVSGFEFNEPLDMDYLLPVPSSWDNLFSF